MAASLSVARPVETGVWTARLQWGAQWAAWLVAAIALAGFLGWAASLPILSFFGADFPPVLPSSIAVLALTAIALDALRRPNRKRARQAARGAAFLIIVLAFYNLLRRFGGVPMGVDASLGPYGAWLELSFGSAATYLLLAAALALAPSQDASARSLSRWLGVATAGVALVALVSLTFRIVHLDLTIPSIGMALPVAVGLLAAGFSLVAREPSVRLLQLLEHDSPGAAVVRRLLPLAIALPLLLGWAQALGHRSGWFDIAAGEGALTVFMIVACTGLVLWTSGKLDEMNVRRSLAEMRAETQREWLEVTLAHIGDGVITANAEGRVGFMNPASAALIGVEPAAAVGKPVSDLLELVDEHTEAPIQSTLLRAYDLRQPVNAGGDPALRTRDGRLRPVDVSAMPIQDGQGRLLGGVLVLRDASTRRAREKALRDAYDELDRRVEERTQALEKAGAALRESTALLETIAASTPELIMAKDAELRIMMVNPAALAAFGLSREEVVGRREIDLFGDTAESRERLDRDLQVLEGGEAMAVEEGLMTQGGLRTFLVTKSPLRDADGRILGLVSLATDITERKRAEWEMEQLLLTEHRLRWEAERASRAKDEFLAVVSHELRSPLNALKGWSQILSGARNPDPILSARAAEAIRRNVEHQTRLIDDLLDTSRIILGKLVLDRRPVNLVDVVHAAIDLSRASALAKKIELRFDFALPVMMVSGDPGRLQQVVINLLSNGIKFTSAGGQVHISLQQAGERVELAVEDNGIGIDKDFLPHVFDRFSQADASTTRRYSGLGIGLALVRHLVEMHGGLVRAASAGPGLGSTFTVDLPAAQAVAGAAPAVERRAQPRADLRGIQVLVVDDDPDAREVMQLTLTGLGAQVSMFDSGVSLVAMLREQPLPPQPTVLLLDIAMPGEDGFSVLARVRAVEGLAFIPAIAVTALTHLDASRLASAGFQGRLGKPVEAGRLVECIVGVMGRREAGRLEDQA